MAIEAQNLSHEIFLPACKAAVIYVPLRHYNCRESSTNQPFYAKQTQFPKKSNESKYLFTKGL